jgi:hypothetical protein
MSVLLIIVVGVAAVVGIGLALRSRSRRPETGVESFRRHIDALSPDARREVMDRVRNQNDRDSS